MENNKTIQYAIVVFETNSNKDIVKQEKILIYKSTEQHRVQVENYIHSTINSINLVNFEKFKKEQNNTKTFLELINDL